MTDQITLSSIQDAVRAGRFKEAGQWLRKFLGAMFPLDIEFVEIRRDTLSLNSVNGFVQLKSPESSTGETVLFFKFHHEENEEGLKEYYNSKLLETNGFPVEMPLYASHEVGRQILVYPFKQAERMADLCKKLDDTDCDDSRFWKTVEVQAQSDRQVSQRYIATLHEADIREIHAEPLLQLFHHRLADDRDRPDRLGGRYRSFYAGKTCELPANSLITFEDLASLHWRVNGVEYQQTLAQSFRQAFKILSPSAHALPGGKRYPALVAHGDAHNGNVWYNEGEPPSLSFFDPAFAGPHVPALLAEIKPTFHNIFAHPLWLYDSKEADAKLEIAFSIKDHVIDVRHDWKLPPIRQKFLHSKRDRLWKPLLAALREKHLLPHNWQAYMRSALFCCPTLVMNLRAHAGSGNNSHTPKTSLLGFAVAVSLASPPLEGSDSVSDFFAAL